MPWYANMLRLRPALLDTAISLAAAVAVVPAWFVISFPFMMTSRPNSWAFHSILLVAGAVGLAVGRLRTREVGLLPLVIGWLIPYGTIFALMWTPWNWHSPYPWWIEKPVKSSAFLAVPFAGICGTLIAEGFRHRADWGRLVLFVVLLVALTAFYVLAFDSINYAVEVERNCR